MHAKETTCLHTYSTLRYAAWGKPRRGNQQIVASGREWGKYWRHRKQECNRNGADEHHYPPYRLRSLKSDDAYRSSLNWIISNIGNIAIRYLNHYRNKDQQSMGYLHEIPSFNMYRSHISDCMDSRLNFKWCLFYTGKRHLYIEIIHWIQEKGHW